MTIFKMSEKRPNLDAYCFVKTTTDQWVFGVYNGTEDEPDKWTFLCNPSEHGIGIVDEWQPANIMLNQPSVDIKNMKIIYNITDVVNDENMSFLDSFKCSFGGSHDDTSGNNGHIES